MGKKKTGFYHGQNFLLFLSMLAFVLIASQALLWSEENYAKIFSKTEEFIEFKKTKKTFVPIPQLKEEVLSFPIISAQAALAIDLSSMVPLYEKNPDAPLMPASTTKIVTALVALENYPSEAILKVEGKKVEGQKMNLLKGEEITAENLIKGLLISSANDAAEVLADNFPGGREAFVKAMNQKAKELHLTNTNFKNPTGFDGQGHFSTARDLVRVSIIAMQNPKFSEIVKIKELTVQSADGQIKHELANTNKLLGEEGVLGVKTGWTENARENLVTYLEKDDKKIMLALLGSQDRFGETKELMDWIFSSYEWKEVQLETSSWNPKIRN